MDEGSLGFEDVGEYPKTSPKGLDPFVYGEELFASLMLPLHDAVLRERDWAVELPLPAILLAVGMLLMLAKRCMDGDDDDDGGGVGCWDE